MDCRASICVLAGTLAGCAAVGTPNLDRNYELARSTDGVVVSSFTVSGYVPGIVWFQIVPAANPSDRPVSVTVNDRATGVDWDGADGATSDGTGRLVVLGLAPGEYEVRRFTMNVANAGAWTSTRPLGVRFTVRPGEASYIGNVHVEIERGASARLPFRVAVEDRGARDLGLLARRYPGIPQGRVTHAVGGHPRPSDGSPSRLEDLRDLLRK